MSLYDIGRPTGVMGGVAVAKQTKLDQDRQKLDTNYKQAEFYDYLDGIEQRKLARKRTMVEDEATIEEQPTKTEANIATNKTTTKKQEAERDLIEPQKKAQLDALHRNMKESQFNDVSRVYFNIKAGIEAGRPKDELYAQGRQSIVSLSRDPDAMSQFLDSMGVTEEMTPESFNAMGQLSHYGVYDAPTTRARELMEVEMSAKIQLERAASRAGKDLSSAPATSEELKWLGNYLVDRVPAMEGVQGVWDPELDMWTGPKGAMVKAFSDMSRRVIMDQKEGGAISPSEMVEIYADIVNDFPNAFTTTTVIGENSPFGTGRRTGGEFLASTFGTVMDGVNTNLRHLRAADASDPFRSMQGVYRDHRDYLNGYIKELVDSPAVKASIKREAEDLEKNREKEDTKTEASKEPAKESKQTIGDVTSAMRKLERVGKKHTEEWESLFSKLQELRKGVKIPVASP